MKAALSEQMIVVPAAHVAAWVPTDVIARYWRLPEDRFGEQEWLERRAAEWREFWSRLPQEKPIPHDPQWRERFFSLQSAHDGNHWVWKVAWWAMQAGTVAGPAAGMLVR